MYPKLPKANPCQAYTCVYCCILKQYAISGSNVQEMFDRIDKEADGEVYVYEVCDFLSVLDDNMEQNNEVTLSIYGFLILQYLR